MPRPKTKLKFIDETMIPLKDAPKYVPWTPSIGALNKWCKKGICVEKGKPWVKLEHSQLGMRGHIRTSVEAIQRFLKATGFDADPETRGGSRKGGAR